MRSYTHYFIFIFTLLIVYSCNSNTRGSQKIPSLNMHTASEIDFDDLIDDVKCIALENLPNAYLIDCWKIIKHNDYFYLYSLSSFAVCIFDSEGHFVNRIDSKAPGAIEMPSDIFINEKQEQLWIIENRNIIKKYSLNGSFISKEKLNFYAVKLINLDNDNYLFYDGGFDKNASSFIRHTAPDLKTMNTFTKKINTQFRTMGISIFTNDENKRNIYSLLPNIDTVYISKKEHAFAPLFHLDFGGSFLTLDMYPPKGFSDKEMAEIINKRELIYNITGFHFASGWLFMQLQGKDNSFRAIDIATQSVYRFNSLIDGVYMYLQGSTPTSLFVSMSAKDFINAYKKNNMHTKYQSIQKVLNDSLINRNRILIEIKIKNNL